MEIVKLIELLVSLFPFKIKEGKMGTDWSPLWISLKTSILSTIITFVIGIFVSYIMANYRGKWKGLIDGLFTLPLILPPTVVGFFLLLLCGKNGFIGKFY